MKERDVPGDGRTWSSLSNWGMAFIEDGEKGGWRKYRGCGEGGFS